MFGEWNTQDFNLILMQIATESRSVLVIYHIYDFGILSSIFLKAVAYVQH